MTEDKQDPAPKGKPEIVEPDDATGEALEPVRTRPLVRAPHRARLPAWLTRLTKKRVEAETEYLGALKDHHTAALGWRRALSALRLVNLDKTLALDEQHLDEAVEETTRRREVAAATHKVTMARLQKKLGKETRTTPHHTKSLEEVYREGLARGTEAARLVRTLKREVRIDVCGEDREPETLEEKRGVAGAYAIIDRLYKEGLS